MTSRTGQATEEGIYDGTLRIGAVGKTPFGEWWAQDAASEGIGTGYFKTHAEATRAVFDAYRARVSATPR